MPVARRGNQAVLSFNAARNTSVLLIDVNGDSAADSRLEIAGNVSSGSGFRLILQTIDLAHLS